MNCKWNLHLKKKQQREEEQDPRENKFYKMDDSLIH